MRVGTTCHLNTELVLHDVDFILIYNKLPDIWNIIQEYMVPGLLPLLGGPDFQQQLCFIKYGY
jgi:hypothetical protein